ncbi:MAG: DUF1861 family protein [Bacilli bacterium]|jgi:hypothetical protein
MKKINLQNYIDKHRQETGVLMTKRIRFHGFPSYDVYNISQAFTFKGKTYIAGRVEKRASEVSTSVIFEQIAPYDYQATQWRIENLQDPFVELIDNHILLGGTEIYPDQKGDIVSWRTVFYYGADFDSLEKIIYAPAKMKDVRIAKNDKYYVMSRPQGGVAAYGKIGFQMAENLCDVTTEFIDKSPLIKDLFDDKVWGGANQILILSNGLLGVLGHAAIMSEGNVRHYYGMTFALDPKTGQRTDMKIIAEKRDFGESEYKRKDLIDVIFVGGIVRHDNKTASLYTGLSDAEGHVALIDDPFIEYEELEGIEK